MKIWKKLLIPSVSLVLAFLPSGITNGCGDSGEYDDPYGYSSYFAPEVFSLKEYSPLFFTHRYYYDFEWYNEFEPTQVDTLKRKENLLDWRGYFKKKASWSDIEALVYEADSAELAAVDNFVTGKSKDLKEEWRSNSLVQLLKKKNKQYPDLVPYLQFVRQCSPYVLENSSTDDGENWENDLEQEATLEENEEDNLVRPSSSRNTPNSKALKMQALLQEGLAKYKSASSAVVKLRYGYQLVRLAHYAYDYKQCVELYDQLIEPLQISSPIKYWALGHKAGALLKLEETQQALYQYAVVYQNAPSQRLKAYEGFVRYGGGVCEDCLSFAKNNQEKIGLLTLQAVTLDYSPIALESMQQIYALDPKSENLELLLMRELNKQEANKIGDNPDFYVSQNGSSVEIVTVEDSQQGGDTKPNDAEGVKAFVQKMAGSSSTRRPYLWKFAAGYIAFLDKDYLTAEKYFNQVKKEQPKDQLLLSQLQLLELVQRYSQLNKIDPAVEDQILRDLQWIKSLPSAPLRTQDAHTHITNKIINLYRRQKDEVKYSLMTKGEHFKELPDYKFNERMIAFLQSTSKTPLEEFLLKDYPHTVSSLYNEQGVIQLSNYQFKDAVATFKKVKDPKLLLELPADPFAIRIKDCKDCDYEIYYYKKKPYNNLTFAQRMVELQELLKTDPKNADQYNFLLGNAFYNLTFYGNAWSAIGSWDTFSNNSKLFTQNLSTGKNEYNLRNLYDCLQAQRYYEAGRRVAKNKEMAAKLAFMAAKSELNRYYMDPTVEALEDYDEVRIPPQYRNYFRLLKARYADTKYYEQIIKECGYFASFNGVKPKMKTPEYDVEGE